MKTFKVYRTEESGLSYLKWQLIGQAEAKVEIEAIDIAIHNYILDNKIINGKITTFINAEFKGVQI